VSNLVKVDTVISDLERFYHSGTKSR